MSKAAQELKANASRFARSRVRDFQWQEKFGGFSVSQSQSATVVRYIQRQKEHHKKMSFEDEFVKLLKAHNVEYDPKFLFR